MSEGSFIEKLNPAAINLNALKDRVGEKVKIREIGSRGTKPDLDQVFRESLLGYRRSGIEVDEDSLTQYENSLRNKPDLDLKAVVDFDGVVVDPSRLQQKAGVGNMLWLARLARSSNNMTIWTNRFQPDKGLLSKSGTFPFMGKEVSKRIMKVLGDNENVSILKKKLKGNSDSLIGIVEKSDITIFIGSSNIDRKIVNDYVKMGGNTDKLVYFDTGGLIL